VLIRVRRGGSVVLESSPSPLVQASVLDRFGQVLHPDIRCGLQVGNGAGDFQDPVVRSCREIQPLHGMLQQHIPFLAQAADLPDLFRRDLRIAIDSFIIQIPFLLYLPGRHHPFPDHLRFLG